MTTPSIETTTRPELLPEVKLLDIGDVIPDKLVAEAGLKPEASGVTVASETSPSTPATPTPESTGSAPSPTPEPISEVTQLRRQLMQVEAEKQEQSEEAALVQKSREIQQSAIARGLSEDDALWVAQQHYAISKQVGQQRAELRRQQQYLQDKQAYAAFLAQKHAVSATLLMSANTPEDMVAIAEREKHYMGLEADIKMLKQARVPPQQLNRVGGSAAGNLTVTSENIDRLWTAYDIAHPGMPNPYDQAYRRLVHG